MPDAPEMARRICLGAVLAFIFLGSVPNAQASVRRASSRHRRHALVARRAGARATSASYRFAARRAFPISLTSVRIPTQLPATVAQSAPASAFPPQVEQRIPRQSPRTTAALQGMIKRIPIRTRRVVGALIVVTNRATAMDAGHRGGCRRRLPGFPDLAPGTCLLLAQADGFEKMTRDDLRLDAGDVVTLELTLAPSASAASPVSRLPRMPEPGPPLPAADTVARSAPSYREMRRRPDAEPGQEIVMPEILPPAQEVFLEMPDRWNIAMPQWNRYGRSGEYPYVRASHWWDPFNRNRLKGDVPIFGQQTFLNITATSDTLIDGRRVPVASGVSTAQPGSGNFFGRGEELAPSETLRFSFDRVSR